jgi:hypothetical protein
MSRAISSRRKTWRISETIVELPVARAMTRWNLRSSWRKRSSWRRKSAFAASSRLRSIVARIAWKSASLACAAASSATRGSSRRRASSTPATSETRISQLVRSRSRGTSSERTKIPPLWPRRTSSTPASASTLTASRSVGRLIRICAASSRSDGSRSPTWRSPVFTFSAICSTASSKVWRVATGSNARSTAGEYRSGPPPDLRSAPEGCRRPAGRLAAA